MPAVITVIIDDDDDDDDPCYVDPLHVITAWCVLGLRMEVWRVAANILNNLSRQQTMGGARAWDLGEGIATPHRKNPGSYEILHRTSDLASSCESGNEPSGFHKRRGIS
jgi:hypothetical protein